MTQTEEVIEEFLFDPEFNLKKIYQLNRFYRIGAMFSKDRFGRLFRDEYYLSVFFKYNGLVNVDACEEIDRNCDVCTIVDSEGTRVCESELDECKESSFTVFFRFHSTKSKDVPDYEFVYQGDIDMEQFIDNLLFFLKNNVPELRHVELRRVV